MSNCQICGINPIVGRGLCRAHYIQMQRKGLLQNFNIKKDAVTLKDRILKKIIKHDSGCWLWNGQKNDYGYGLIWKEGKAVRAHRVSYEIFNGAIPEGAVICHSCDIPACINPAHLFHGTRDDNNKDSVKKMRNAFGERNGHSTLSSEQINAIRNDQRKQKEIALDYGITQSHVSRIKSLIRRPKG